MGLHINLKRWKKPLFYTLIALTILEFPLTVATLALFGIADPDTYRTRLWLDGSINNFNSDPSTILYSYANYKPVDTPLIWSGALTKYNLVISVLSMFILLLKAVLVPMHVMFPIVSFFIHALEVGLWSYSVYGQTSHDTIDPNPSRHNNGLPWYISKSCSVAAKKENVGYCQQAKASFYVTVVMLALFAVLVLLSLYSIFTIPAPGDTDDDIDDVDHKSVSSTSYGKRRMSDFSPADSENPYPEREWEMVRIPDTPGTTGGIKSPLPPVTPRTQAFNALDGGYVASGGVSKPLAPWGRRREEQEKLPWSVDREV